MSSEYYSNYFNNVYASLNVFFFVAYNITVLNSSGTAILLTYGSVGDWWLSHHDVINTQGFIQVCYKKPNQCFYNINLHADFWQGFNIWEFQNYC